MIQVPPIVGTIIVIAIYGSMFAGCLWIAFNAARTLRLTANTGAWRKTMGRIVRSGVKEVWVMTWRYYAPDIVYEYTADDRTYQSDRLSFAKRALPFEEAERLAQQLCVGVEVTVHYHPIHCNEAFLQDGGRYGAAGDLIAALLCAVLGAVMLAASFV